MCGIVGFTGRREAAPILLEGLRRLEYRGYDSAGLVTEHRQRTAPPQEGRAARRAARGTSPHSPAPGCYGISHTRWATHGGGHRPQRPPAHRRGDGAVAVVHNGVIENYAALKHQLQADGVAFHSDTDTEVIAHLDRPLLRRRPASRPCGRRCALLKGTYGLAVDEPARARR